MKRALEEAEAASQEALEKDDKVELNPQGAYIRRLQHLIAEKNALISRSHGKDPGRRVRIYSREPDEADEDDTREETGEADLLE